MASRDQDAQDGNEHIEITPTEARQGQSGYVRYILLASLMLVVIGFLVTAAVTLS